MPTQNLISATLVPADAADIVQQLLVIRKKLPFLLTLSPDEIRALVKVGHGFSPFLDQAYQVAQAHPEILPGVFDREEFLRDYQLAQTLAQIAAPLTELANALENTLTAARSDAMNSALEVYTAVKQHADKVPGLTVVASEMGEYFKRTKKKPAAAT